MQKTIQSSKLHYADSQFPELLREISHPPTYLHVAGKLRADIPLVAIVGTRRPTPYGKQVAHQLTTALADAGVGIVSGMAIGIDAIAHSAALDAGGYTIAILGSGINNLYPPSNRALGYSILANGGTILSEYAADTPALPHHFPTRNRLISGLCRATIVIEATTKSGSLITASCALDQDREVFAVPGNITSNTAEGPNRLIAKGATPLLEAKQVLEALHLPAQSIGRPTPRNKHQVAVLNCIESGITTSQQIIEATGITAAEFSQAITLMELAGTVRNLGAGVWVAR